MLREHSNPLSDLFDSEELLARTPRSTDGTSRVGIDSERLALGAGLRYARRIQRVGAGSSFATATLATVTQCHKHRRLVLGREPLRRRRNL